MSSDLIMQWLAYIKERFTPRTVDQYIYRIERYTQSINHFPANANELEKYITNFASHHGTRTTNAHLTAIKSFYTWAEKIGIENISHSVHFLTNPPPKVRCLSEKEYELVLNSSKGELHNAIQFLGNTGLRESEFRSITWRDFSPDLQFVHINGKGRKLREVPLNNTCRQLLLIPHKGTRPDFVDTFKVQHSFYNGCCELADRVRIPHFGSHAIRHFFATRLINLGCPLTKISIILGHSSTLTTEKIYCHITPQHLLHMTDILAK